MSVPSAVGRRRTNDRLREMLTALGMSHMGWIRNVRMRAKGLGPLPNHSGPVVLNIERLLQPQRGTILKSATNSLNDDAKRIA